MTEPTISTSPIIRLPAGTLRQAATRLGLIGAGIGLFFAAILIAVDQSKAGSISPVYVEARSLLLHYQAEKNQWPVAFNLAQPGPQLAGFKMDALQQALAACELPGQWTFMAPTGTERAAIIFTPTEPGTSFTRTLGVVDQWIDDDEPATGDLRVTRARAVLSLSAE